MNVSEADVDMCEGGWGNGGTDIVIRVYEMGSSHIGRFLAPSPPHIPALVW